MSSKAVVSQEKLDVCRDLLAELCTGENTPGTVVADMSRLLDYLAANKLSAVGKYKTFPMNRLAEMNELLSVPYPHALKRPQLRSFPCLQALYLLARVTGLMVVSGGKKAVLKVDKAQVQRWQEMNPQARYAALLDAWLGGFDPTILGLEKRWDVYPYTLASKVLAYLPRGDEAKHPKTRLEAVKMMLSVGHPFSFGALRLFGLLDVRFDKPDAKGAWLAKRLKVTGLGKKLMAALPHTKTFPWSPAELDYEALETALIHLFPKWEGTLDAEASSIRRGTYVFRLCYEDDHELAVSSEDTLEMFAWKIIDLFQFESGHLYHFELISELGSRWEVMHPGCQEGPWADEYTVGSIRLRDGDTFTFIYDFGAWHEVTVTLEAIRVSS